MTNIFGVRIDIDKNMSDIVSLVDSYLLSNSEETRYICTVNPEFLVDSLSDNEFKDILNSSWINTPDGIGVIIASIYKDFLSSESNKDIFLLKKMYFYFKSLVTVFIGQHSYNRVTGADLFSEICSLAASKNYSIYILGGMYQSKKMSKENLASDVVGVLRKKYPGINIVGGSSAYKKTQEDDEATINEIKSAMGDNKLLDILFVAYGHNHQEKWISRNAIKIPARLSVGIGGTLNYEINDVSRAPSWLIKRNLEWLYRLIKQPSRIGRILKATVIFSINLLKIEK